MHQPETSRTFRSLDCANDRVGAWTLRRRVRQAGSSHAGCSNTSKDRGNNLRNPLSKVTKGSLNLSDSAASQALGTRLAGGQMSLQHDLAKSRPLGRAAVQCHAGVLKQPIDEIDRLRRGRRAQKHFGMRCPPKKTADHRHRQQHAIGSAFERALDPICGDRVMHMTAVLCATRTFTSGSVQQFARAQAGQARRQAFLDA